jgi:hypothetical protein
MNRRRRDYQKYLSAFWAWKYPARPEKTNFSDEVILAVEFIMLQIDPTGMKPIFLPPMPAEGYETQRNVRSKSDVEVEA